jgi:hypothetical protein
VGHWRLNHLPGPFRDTDIRSNKCRGAPQKFNKLVLVDRNCQPLLGPGTWTRHNVGHALDFCLQWDTVLPGPHGRLPSGHVGCCSDPQVSKPQFYSLSPLGDLFQSPYGKFHRALATGPTPQVLHGVVYCATCLLGSSRYVASFPASPCAWEPPTSGGGGQLRLEWVPTKPTSHPLLVCGHGGLTWPGSREAASNWPDVPGKALNKHTEMPVKRNGFPSELAAAPSDATRLRN